MDNGDKVLSQHEGTEGFNLESGKTWIYPTNLPIRDYQYNIVNEALFKNTMVCLPTGLGKTFIAAVVMYNYYRWYPHGKIIFMAPTKPLVKQQVEACYNIMAIPTDVTAELTGTTAQSSRDEIWEGKRVFFITPQVLQNDLERIARLGKQIKCLVFDEAHKARGNHAYCEIVKKISPVSKYFRVLALTATPGSNISEVVKVCSDLLISHIEIRTEDSADVAPFVFKKNIQTVVVPLDAKLCQVRDDYIQVLDKYVRVLVENRVMQGNCSSLTKGRLFYIKKEYEEKNRFTRGPQHNEIMKNLSICLILYHAYEVLTKHGLRGFLMFFNDHQDNPLLRSNNQIRMIINDISNYLGPIPVVDMLPDGTIPEIPKTTKFGHPKFYKLAEILTSHFNKKKESKNNQVIVFCEYRESVIEAYTLLLMYVPLIKPKIFLGQGMITQKQQINVIQSFRSGDCNTLVSTSIGEEGLDIGDVNLVVCFDISNKSSIRMIQRIGRTGRKQEGNVIMLVTEGKEHQLLKESFAHKDYMIEAMKTSRELHSSLKSYSAKMIPDNIKPVCNKIFITVDKPKKKLKNKSLMSMFDNMNHNSMCDDADKDFEDRIPELMCYSNKTKTEILTDLSNKNVYNVETNRFLHSTLGQIGSSVNSKMLVSLLEFADAKRYNIPLLQSNVISQQTTKNNFKQSDIRTMFRKKQTSQEESAQTPVHHTDENPKNKMLQLELNEYLSVINLNSFNCNICENLFKCTTYKPEIELMNFWMPPNINILDSLTKDGLDDFANGLKSKYEVAFDEIDDDILAEFVVDDDIHQNKESTGDVFDLDAEMADTEILPTPKKTSSVFDMPKSAKKILLAFKNEEEVISSKCNELDSIHKNDASNIIQTKTTLDLNNFYSDENAILEEINKESPTYTGKPSVKSEKYKNFRSQSPDLFDDSNEQSRSPINNVPQQLKQQKEVISSSISIDDIFDTTLLGILKGPEFETNKQKLLCDKNSIAKPKQNKSNKTEINDKNSTAKPKPNKSNKTEINQIKPPIINKIEQNKTITSNDDVFDDSFLDLLREGSNVPDINIIGKQETSKNPTKGRKVENIERKIIANNQRNFNPKQKLTGNSKESTLKKKINSSSLQISDIFDDSILSNLTDIDSTTKIDKTQSKSINTQINKRIDMNKLSCKESSKNEDLETSTSPILSSYENNIRKSRFKLSQIRESKSPKTKIPPKDKALVNCEDIFGDDFLLDVSFPQIPQTAKTQFQSDLEFSNINNISDKEDVKGNTSIPEDKNTMLSIHQEKDVINKTPNSLRENKSMSSSKGKDSTPKSVEKEMNISQESDTTLIISPDTLSMFSEMHSPTKNKSVDDDDFESPTYSYYKGTKNQSHVKCKEQNKVTPLLNSEDSCYFDNMEAKKSNNVTVKDKIYNTPGSKNKFSTKKKSLNTVSPIKTSNNFSKSLQKQISNEDIFDTTMLDVFDDTHKKTNINDANKKCKYAYKNTSMNNENSDISQLKIKQNSQKNSKLQSTLKPSLINNSMIDSILQKYSSPPNSKVMSKTRDALCGSPILNKTLGSPNSSLNKSKSYDSPNSTVSRKRCFTESPNSPVLSGKKRRTLDDLDDDFEESTFLASKTKRKQQLIESVNISSDDDFEASFVRPKPQPIRKGKKKKGGLNDFLEMEAALSSDASVSSDERSGSSQDVMEESFVDDNTLDLGNTTALHAHYLQTARSPMKMRGFKIPQLPAKINSDIFSQSCNYAENTYLEDSFCVASDKNESSEEELSELEIAERKLKDKRRMKKDSEIPSVKRKRNRILVISSDSD